MATPQDQAQSSAIPRHPDGVASALDALRVLCRAMPPVAAMGVEVVGFEQGILRLQAPLALNVNDKGSAFGGSLTSLMTLCGWGLGTLQLALAGMQADIYVADSQVRYLRPLQAGLVAEAWLADGESWQAFAETLALRGRARATLNARVPLPDGSDAATLEGRYVAVARG